MFCISALLANTRGCHRAGTLACRISKHVRVAPLISYISAFVWVVSERLLCRYRAEKFKIYGGTIEMSLAGSEKIGVD